MFTPLNSRYKRDYSTGDVAVLFHRGEIPKGHFTGAEGLFNWGELCESTLFQWLSLFAQSPLSGTADATVEAAGQKSPFPLPAFSTLGILDTLAHFRHFRICVGLSICLETDPRPERTIFSEHSLPC